MQHVPQQGAVAGYVPRTVRWLEQFRVYILSLFKKFTSLGDIGVVADNRCVLHCGSDVVAPKAWSPFHTKFSWAVL